MTDKKATLDKVFKHGSNEDIKRMVMEETKISDNKALVSKGVFLVTVVVDCLVHLRDKYKKELSVDLYNEHLDLKSLMMFSDHNTIPLEDVFKVKNYLKLIPGFDISNNFFDQKEMVKTHHERVKSSVTLFV